MGFDVGWRHIGDGSPCFVIAEVGLAHGGSLGLAHSYVEAVAKREVDAVKFQCHLGDPVSEWRVHPEWAQDENRQAYWKRTGFESWEWEGLAAHAQSLGLEFLCSPFSVEAVRMLDPLVPAWKVPSGKVMDVDLLKALESTQKPWLISTGMATYEEIQNALIPPRKFAVLQSTSMYPCPPEKIGLLAFLNASMVPRGLSDHSGTIYPGLAAVALGCDVLEVHVCFSKEQGGFDTAASIDMEDLARLVEGVRFIERAKQPVDKDALAKELEPMRRVFMGEGA